MTAPFDPEVSFTVFTNPNGLMTKTVNPNGRGGVDKKPAAQMWEGVAETVTKPFSEFGPFLRTLKHHQAICHGVTGHDHVRIVSVARFTEQPGTITRTKEYFKYSDGWGLAMLDHDPKPGQTPLTLEQLIAAASSEWPGFRALPKWSTPSTSSCIYDMDGNKLTGEGNGCHLYFPFKPASKLPELADVLLKRMWLAGHGYIVISRAGSMLVRSIFDASVFSAERLDFVAGANCVDCEQRLPDPEYFEGSLLDADIPLPPPLTQAEENLFDALVKANKEKKRPEAERVTAARKKEEIKILREERGISEDEAAAIVQSRHEAKLQPGEIVRFQDGAVATVEDILAEPQKYHNRACADPLEPEEGTSRAKLFVNNNGSVVIHSMLHGRAIFILRPSKEDDQAEKDKELLTGILDVVAEDCGAAYAPEVIAAFARLRRRDKPEFMRLRDGLKKANAGVIIKEFDTDVRIHNRQARRGGKAVSPSRQRKPSSGGTLSPSIRAQIARFHGALVTEPPEGGDEELCPQSEAASLLADRLRGHYAYRLDAASWFRFDGTHWRQIKQLEVEEVITAMIYAGAGDLGFSNAYQAGVAALLQKGGGLGLEPRPGGLIPFANGLLDTKTKTLGPTTPENAQTWCLPFDYVPGAQCPAFLNWLRVAVDGDEETARLLQAFFNALLTGRADLHRFLHLIGPAGTGKSTFGRMACAIVGPENCTTTTLEHLEHNRFELANVYGKRLVAIEEADQYGGSVNVLKSMTGQDPLRLERKNQQQSGNFIYEGQVIMMSNERLATTDYTSGIERRRVTVEFKRRITAQERADWDRRGGEQTILHAEIPGIIRWALELTRDEVTTAFQVLPERVRQANLDALVFNNPLADWMLDSCLPGGEARIGDGREVSSGTGERVFANADTLLYPSYLLWSKRAGRKHISLNKFSKTLEDAAQQFGATAKKHRKPVGTIMVGVRLRLPQERRWKDQMLGPGG